MSKYRFQEWKKRADRLQENFSQVTPVWDENDNTELEKVKKQWHRQQQQAYQKIQVTERKSKQLRHSLQLIMVLGFLGIIIGFFPQWWGFTRNTWVTVTGAPHPEKVTSKPNFLQRLRALEQKNLGDENCQGENSCQPVTLEDRLNKSVDNIEKYNDNLQNVIDISDGKTHSLTLTEEE